MMCDISVMQMCEALVCWECCDHGDQKMGKMLDWAGAKQTDETMATIFTCVVSCVLRHFSFVPVWSLSAG